jgi:hypothetical protein
MHGPVISPARRRPGGSVSSLAIYIVGFVIVVGGLAYGASLAGLAPQWIAVGCLVLVGVGIATGVTRTRQKDPSHD